MMTFATDAPRIARRTLAQRFDSYLRTISRADRIDALRGLSDADLGRIGLSRADVPRHVYQGMMHL